MLSCFEQHRSLPIETCELLRVDFGHLEECDAETDDEKAEDHGNQGNGGGFQALIQDEGRNAHVSVSC